MSNIYQFTVEEAIETAERPPPTGARASRRPGSRGDWAGESFEESMRMAREGDPESALAVKKAFGVLAKIRYSSRPSMKFSETGSVMDVGRFLDGDPECMIEVRRRRKPMPVLRIGVERSIGSRVDADEIRATGGSVMAVVEALRTAGAAAEVWVTYSQGAKEIISCQVLVQEAGRPMNIERLAFWIANPGAFRRVGFAIEEQQPESVRVKCGITERQSYGYPTTPPNAEFFDEVAPSNSWAVEAWIKDVMQRRVGIEIEGTDM